MTQVSDSGRDKPTKITGCDGHDGDFTFGCPGCHTSCGNQEAERRIVEWLRSDRFTAAQTATPVGLADAIERGEHRG